MEKKHQARNRVRLEKLYNILHDKTAMLIVLQDFPDPDAVASAAALKELARSIAGLSVSIACGGVVGRSENRSLVRYMDINLLSMLTVDIDQYDVVAMVDTQPSSGNNALPHNVVPNIVIDHHPINRITRKSEFHDVRKYYGSTSTILYEYLKSAGVSVSTQLATALVYGIRSDTDDLGREISSFDVEAFVDLFPSVNHRIMGRVQMASLPAEYFEMLHEALINARKYGSSVAANLGSLKNPDMIGEVADLLLRAEDCKWALCFGYYDGRLLLSLRTADPASNAGHVMRMIVSRKGTGGGHSAMAGGQIEVRDPRPAPLRRLEEMIINRFLKHSRGEKDKPVKLIKAAS